MTVDIPLWSKKKRDKYVLERVRIHQEAEFLRLTGDKLPLCTDQERWKSEAKFAVIKKGNKRAKRVCSSLADAEKYIEDNELKKFEIVERPSIPNRCAQGWCPIAEWCDQYQDELNQEK